MPKHRDGFGSKAEEGIRGLIVLFLVVPAVLFGLMSAGGLAFSSIAGVETLYYILAILMVAVKGLEWLEDFFD